MRLDHGDRVCWVRLPMAVQHKCCVLLVCFHHPTATPVPSQFAVLLLLFDGCMFVSLILLVNVHCMCIYVFVYTYALVLPLAHARWFHMHSPFLPPCTVVTHMLHTCMHSCTQKHAMVGTHTHACAHHNTLVPSFPLQRSLSVARFLCTRSVQCVACLAQPPTRVVVVRACASLFARASPSLPPSLPARLPVPSTLFYSLPSTQCLPDYLALP